MDFISKREVPPPSACIATSEGSIKMPLNHLGEDGVVEAPKTVPWERRFEPYDFNGGVCATYSFFFTLFNSDNSLLSTLSCLSF